MVKTSVLFDAREFECLKQTFDGRELLRQRGINIEEVDPELQFLASMLRDEREREFAEWSADLDAEFYGA